MLNIANTVETEEADMTKFAAFSSSNASFDKAKLNLLLSLTTASGKFGSPESDLFIDN